MHSLWWLSQTSPDGQRIRWSTCVEIAILLPWQRITVFGIVRFEIKLSWFFTITFDTQINNSCQRVLIQPINICSCFLLLNGDNKYLCWLFRTCTTKIPYNRHFTQPKSIEYIPKVSNTFWKYRIHSDNFCNVGYHSCGKNLLKNALYSMSAFHRGLFKACQITNQPAHLGTDIVIKQACHELSAVFRILIISSLRTSYLRSCKYYI